MNSIILFFALAGGEELFHTKPKPMPERAEQRQEAVKPLISHEATSPKSRPFRLEIQYPNAVAEPLPEPVKPKSVQWLYFTMQSCKPCKPIERDLFPWLRASRWKVSGDADSHVRIHDWKGDGDAFQMWAVDRTPTFVLLVDGKETKRYTGDNYPGREAIANEYISAVSGADGQTIGDPVVGGRSINIGTIHGAARLREGLAYAARYMGSERGTLVWSRTGEREFRVGKEHDWKDVVGSGGRLHVLHAGIPGKTAGLAYRRTEAGYMIDPDPLLVPFPTSDAPTAAGSSAVGSSILIISTVLRLAWEVWALTHPSVDIVLPDETKIAAVMQDGKLCIDVESGPAIQLKWSLFFGLWAPKADVPIKAVEISADEIVLQMGSRWVSELRLKVVE